MSTKPTAYQVKRDQLLQMIDARTTADVAQTLLDTERINTPESKLIQNLASGIYRKRMEAVAATKTDADLMSTLTMTVRLEEAEVATTVASIMGIACSNELERRHPDITETILDWEVAWDQEHGPMALEWNAYLAILMEGVRQKSAA